MGLDYALFPFLPLPPPPPPHAACHPQPPLKLWGVTLSLSSQLVGALGAGRLRVPPWRLRGMLGGMLLRLLAWWNPRQWALTG